MAVVKRRPASSTFKTTNSQDGKKNKSSPATNSIIEPKQFSIPNKMKRAEVFAKQKYELMKQRKKLRIQRKKLEEKRPELKEERLKNNVQRTIENMREFDETMVNNNDIDEEVALDEGSDEFSAYFNGKSPKVLITSSQNPCHIVQNFAEELVNVFPNSHFVKRTHHFKLEQVVGFAKNRDYTDIIVVKEDNKKPTGLTFIHLPEGPTAFFSLTNYRAGKSLKGHGRSTQHKPELILNNFSTRLGHTIGRLFASLFPQQPEFQGRQVVTFHNQRDFIFFRKHRYVFNDTDKVGMQELGPRFTLKLRSLQRGTFDVVNADYEWVFKASEETSRKKHAL